MAKKEVIARTAAQTAVLMAILTLVSKFFGFIREMIMAYYFGASHITDAYVMAISVPNIIFSGVLSAVSTVYIPIYSKIVEDKGDIEGNKFTSKSINYLLIIAAFASIIGILFSDQIVYLFANGFKGETAKLCSFFLKVTFSYMIFTSTSGLFESYLQYKGKFLPQIAFNYIVNIMAILAIVVSAFTSYYFLAFGWLLGYMIRFLAVAILSKKNGYSHTATLKRDDDVKNIITLALPVFFGSSIVQIGIFVNKTLASGLTEGSVAALNYSVILINLVTGLTITILTTIIYPRLTKEYSKNETERFSNIVETSTILILIAAIPIALGSMVYSEQIVQVVYERGAFDSAATELTKSVFFFYSIGLVPIAANQFLIKTYYSMHDAKTPMLFSGIAVAVTIVLNLVLVRFMAINGLALATSIGSTCYMLLLISGLRRKYPEVRIIRSKTVLLKILAASIIAVSVSYLIYIKLIMMLSIIAQSRVIQLFLAVVTAGMVYFIIIYLLKIEEIKIIKQIFKR